MKLSSKLMLLSLCLCLAAPTVSALAATAEAEKKEDKKDEIKEVDSRAEAPRNFIKS